MLLNVGITQLLLGLVTIQIVVGQDCRRASNTDAAGRTCKKACRSDGSCKLSRACVCDGLCGLSCLKMKCRKDKLPNGNFVYVDHNLDITVHPENDSRRIAICKRGSTLQGAMQTTCRNGEWEDAIPECAGDPCPPFENFPDDLVVRYDNPTLEGMYPHFTKALFGCADEGAVMESDYKRTCKLGRWRGQVTYPRCVRAKCPALVNGNYGRIMYDGASSQNVEFDSGTLVEVECHEGIFIQTNNRSTCQSGDWIPHIPQCSILGTCQDVDVEVGRYITYNDTLPHLHGSNLMVSCQEENTTLLGSLESMCSNGRWTPPAGKCRTNVAQNRVAYQISQYQDGGPERAIDGSDTSGNEGCSRTLNTLQDHWWFVDLGNNYTVTEIIIYHDSNQLDHNSLLGAVVRIGQERGPGLTQNTIVSRVIEINSNPIRIIVSGSVEGRFVSVDHAGSSESLILCEVQIFGDLSGVRCEYGCVSPRSLPNGEYHVNDSPIRSIEPSSCFTELYLYVQCNHSHIRRGNYVYICDPNSGTLQPHAMDKSITLSTCGLSCPRPQINPNVIYHVVGEDIDPIGNRKEFNEGEEIKSKCEDPRYQLHVGSVSRRCEAGVWTGSAPRCDI